MKALLFFASSLGTIYAAMRFEWIYYTVLFLFLFGSTLVVFLSLYRHLAANRLL